jgi:hypothetical protein
LLRLNKLVEKGKVDHDRTHLKLSFGESHLVFGSKSVAEDFIPLGVLAFDALGSDNGFLASFSVNKFNFYKSVDLFVGEDIFLVSEVAGTFFVIFGVDVLGIILVIGESDGNVGGSDDVEEHLAFSQALV